MELFPNAFVVNIEKGDSVPILTRPPVKRCGAFSKTINWNGMFVDGNSETIYFSRDSGKISGMQRSLSSRIRMNFKASKVTNLVFLSSNPNTATDRWINLPTTKKY